MFNATKKSIFIADDDPIFLKSLYIEFCDDEIFSIESFETAEYLIDNLGLNPDIIILDYHLNSVARNAINGLHALDSLREVNPTIPVIILSSQDNVEVAISCAQHGAFDYIVKSETAFFRLRKTLYSLLLYENMHKANNK